MIKIQPIVKEIILGDLEAAMALSHGYMNMSSYAYQIKSKVEDLAKKPVTITSLVVSLSRIRKDLNKTKPLIQKVKIKNITTKLPLSEIIYDNKEKILEKMESLHKNVLISGEDFFAITMGTSEVDIICSANLENKILKHLKMKPKWVNHNFAAVGISYGSEVFSTPNIFFSLLSITAKARINIEELISTPTELTFIVAEKDFAKTVSLFSSLHRETNKEY
jgi:aspartokinase